MDSCPGVKDLTSEEVFAISVNWLATAAVRGAGSGVIDWEVEFTADHKVGVLG